MPQIGEAAELAKSSLRTVRHYEEMGLATPWPPTRPATPPASAWRHSPGTCDAAPEFDES